MPGSQLEVSTAVGKVFTQCVINLTTWGPIKINILGDHCQVSQGEGLGLLPDSPSVLKEGLGLIPSITKKEGSGWLRGYWDMLLRLVILSDPGILLKRPSKGYSGWSAKESRHASSV